MYSAPFLYLHTQTVELRFKGKALSVSSRSYTGVSILGGYVREKSEGYQKREEKRQNTAMKIRYSR